MENVEATVIRDGDWWVAEFTVGGHDYGTQARTLDGLREAVADAAALMADGDPADYMVTLTT